MTHPGLKLIILQSINFINQTLISHTQYLRELGESMSQSRAQCAIELDLHSDIKKIQRRDCFHTFTQIAVNILRPFIGLVADIRTVSEICNIL